MVRLLSTIVLNSSVQGLFILGNQMVVIESSYDFSGRRYSIVPRQGLTDVKIYDVSDKSSPAIEKQFSVEGSYSSARMYDGTIYLVSTLYPTYDRPYPAYYDGLVAKEISLDRIYYFPIMYNSPSYATVTAIDPKNHVIESAALLVEGSPAMYMSEDNIYLAYSQYINEYELQQEILDLVLLKSI
jgi:inhibitor of cysteine peptidase